MVRIDLRGQAFGRLTVTRFYRKDTAGRAQWFCKCKCGKSTWVDSYNLRTGNTRSCGCLMEGINTTHGCSKTPVYAVWIALRDRCSNPSNKRYPRYGGRGITVCKRWMNFPTFIKDMGPRPSPHHSIERINNNGNYKPSNCKWATAVEQARNRNNNRRPFAS